MDDDLEGDQQTSRSATLLGDSVEVRTRLEYIKDRITKGPVPLKGICLVSCCVAIAFDAFALIADFFTIHPMKFILTLYAATFAFLGLLLEFNHMYCGPLKAWINVWLKLLTRVWGRGLFYIFAGGIHLSLKGLFGYLCGFTLLGSGIACLIVSRVASRKLTKLHDRIVQGHTDDLVYVRQVFNRYDKDNNGSLSVPELAACCKELGTDFAANELVAIFEYLDKDFSGKLSYEEFERWWTGADSVAYDRVPMV
ncbi:Calmodulin [Hondaea fermentalgiana]|uniref:Calmodulin n=1 Tax=Hondaea fermentalgiana TaxID=2315210 RepID=A0A2R5G938_9STRA|nr:Calmodulin [Hondaea fermentalgiana]|eukprot:GBG26849.1 Calmodulin [Hondaea fermentalgiana]